MSLFPFLQASERFLQQMVSLYVASHYKNTPNDLLLMADAPAHHLFALLAPVDESANVMPDILAVVQVGGGDGGCVCGSLSPLST